jgi:hypothetical protein
MTDCELSKNIDDTIKCKNKNFHVEVTIPSREISAHFHVPFIPDTDHIKFTVVSIDILFLKWIFIFSLLEYRRQFFFGVFSSRPR